MTESTDTTDPKDFGWVFLELMGHRQRVGKAREETVAGGMMLRIDVPTSDPGVIVTEFYGTASIYSMRPISEEVAMDQRSHTDPRPVMPADYKPRTQLEDYSDPELKF
jgi:hypothetical protein